jgi:hypothetical protein
MEVADLATLADIDYDDGALCHLALATFSSSLEAADHTNLHRHAHRNAQEAVVLAKRRVQAFDAQVALERKTNQALQLAKNQAHVRDDEEDEEQPGRAPLVDCMGSLFLNSILYLAVPQWTLMNSTSKTQLPSADPLLSHSPAC